MMHPKFIVKIQRKRITCHFKENDLRMPLQLNGIFSHFPCKTPTEEDTENCDETKVLFLTPEGVWDPNSDVHAINEANMMDFEGNMKPEKERVKILLSDVEECKQMNTSSVICDAEVSAIDKVFQKFSVHEVEKRNNDADLDPV